MAKIYNVRNSGNGDIILGLRQVNSYNVYPSTVTATASGTTIPYSGWDNYDWFNVAQTSAGTDSVFLPVTSGPAFGLAAAPIGARYALYAVSAFTLKIIVSSGILINGAASLAVAAGSLAVITRETATAWVAQVITASGVITGSISGSIVGTSTNDNAAAGSVGEFVSSLVAVGAPISLTSPTALDITSISLTAGDWDVEGNVNFTEGSASVTVRTAGLSSTSATLPTDGSEVANGNKTTTTSEINSITLPRKRFSLAATTSIYMVGQATFSAGTVAAYGSVNARRVR